MRRTFGFILVVIVVGIALYLYLRQTERVTPVGAIFGTAIDVMGAQNDLLEIASAEHRFFILHARYGSLEELSTQGDIAIPIRENFTYTAEGGESEFTIIATYTGPDKRAPKRITLDQTLALKSE